MNGLQEIISMNEKAVKNTGKKKEKNTDELKKVLAVSAIVSALK